MGYMRYKAGYHFLSDCVVSSIVGGMTGILIPALHKNKNFEKLSLSPGMINGNAAMNITFHF
jgi:hypothetical protein